jgi:hypothetical protein
MSSFVSLLAGRRSTVAQDKNPEYGQGEQVGQGAGGVRLPVMVELAMAEPDWVPPGKMGAKKR